MKMKKTLIWVASVIGTAAVLILVLQYINTPYNNGIITASGQCLTTAPRDRTAITLRVQTLDKDAAISMKNASAKITEITTFLKTIDVEMQTVRFDSYTKTEWDNQSQKSIDLGIETNIAIEVSAKKIETIENILSKFAGQPNIFSENLRMFTSAETLKPAVEKCLGIAIKNARERATVIAVSDGKKLGDMISANFIETNTDNDVNTMNFMSAARTKVSEINMDGGLVSKDTEVSVNINATFQIK